jgi:hypothetical protein
MDNVQKKIIVLIYHCHKLLDHIKITFVCFFRLKKYNICVHCHIFCVIIVSFKSWPPTNENDQEFFLLHIIQTSSGAHPASYPMGTGGSFPEHKIAREWSWYGDLPQCNRHYQIGAQIREPRCPLDSAPPSNSWRQTHKNAAPQRNRHRPFGPVLNQLPVATTLHPRDSSKATCPVIAGQQDARLLAGRCKSPQCLMDFNHDFAPLLATPGTNQHRRSVAARPATTHRQLDAEKLSRLPARCSPNLSCCCLSGPGRFAIHITALFGATIHRSSQPAWTA